MSSSGVNPLSNMFSMRLIEFYEHMSDRRPGDRKTGKKTGSLCLHEFIRGLAIV